jgi:hypothetical protein
MFGNILTMGLLSPDAAVLLDQHTGQLQLAYIEFLQSPCQQHHMRCNGIVFVVHLRMQLGMSLSMCLTIFPKVPMYLHQPRGLCLRMVGTRR